MTGTDASFNLGISVGTTTFDQPVDVTFSHEPSTTPWPPHPPPCAPTSLDNGVVKFADCRVDAEAQTVAFATSHFGTFFLAIGVEMYRASGHHGGDGARRSRCRRLWLTMCRCMASSLTYRVETVLVSPSAWNNPGTPIRPPSRPWM